MYRFMAGVTMAAALQLVGCVHDFDQDHNTDEEMEATLCVGLCQSVRASRVSKVLTTSKSTAESSVLRTDKAPSPSPEVSSEAAASEAVVPEIAPHLQEFDIGDGCSKETPEMC